MIIPIIFFNVILNLVQISSEINPITIHGLGKYAFTIDWLHDMPTTKYEYPKNPTVTFISSADEYNGANYFITPIPSIKLYATKYQYTFIIYAVCADPPFESVSSTTCGDNYLNCTITSIDRSIATNLCKAMDAVALTLTSAAPSFFQSLPCASIDVLDTNTDSTIIMPICNIFITPDNSYICYNSNAVTIRLGYGGDNNRAYDISCLQNYYQFNIGRSWYLVTSSDWNDGIEGVFTTPIPSIRHDTDGRFFGLSVYIICSDSRNISGLWSTSLMWEIITLTVLRSDAIELCSHLDSTTNAPTISPSVSMQLTFDPSTRPTALPTIDITMSPTIDESINPTIDITMSPTIDESINPTIDITMSPTIDESINPTIDITMSPTIDESISPTIYKTINPTYYQSVIPTIYRSTSIKPTNYISSIPSKSAKPTSSPTIGIPLSSTKRGMVMTSVVGDPSSINARWRHNYKTKPIQFSSASFIPMISDPSVIHQLLPGSSPKILFTFHKPDLPSSAAYIPARDLVTLYWPQIQAIKAEKLVAPGLSKSFIFKYLKDFVNGNGSFVPHFDCINVLWYGSNSDSFLKHIDKVYSLFKKPIYVSEFGMTDWVGTKNGRPTSFKEADVIHFIRNAVVGMEARDFIEGYAYLSLINDPATEFASLWNTDKSIRPTGWIYAGLSANYNASINIGLDSEIDTASHTPFMQTSFYLLITVLPITFCFLLCFVMYLRERCCKRNSDGKPEF